MTRILVLFFFAFIYRNNQAYSYTINHASTSNQPTEEQIEAGINQASAQGRIIAIDARGMSVPAALQQITTLPVTFRSTIGSWHYDITVLSMNFTPTGSVLSIGCRFYVPGSDNGVRIYFGSNTVAVSGKSGFSGDLPILESSLSAAKSNELDDPLNKLRGETQFFEFPIPSLNGQAWMGLGKETKLSFSCGEFKKFTLAGFVKIYGGVERETTAGQVLSDGKPLMLFWDKNDVFDWQDIYFPVTVSRGFHATNTQDIGFHFADNATIILDLSTYQSPPNSPSCRNTAAEAWQGVQFDAFQVRLPNLFKLRNARTLATQGTKLSWDTNGLTGTIRAESIFSIEEGYTDEVNKFGLSLDLLTATYGCNRASTISMQGKIQLGNCMTAATSSMKNLYYNVIYDGLGQLYQVLLKEKETDRFLNSGLTLSTGSTVGLSITNEQFLVQTSLPAKPRLSTLAYNNSICLNFPTTLTVDNCDGYHTKWSSGDEYKTTITVSPSQTTTYTVNCYDNYCISENTEPLTIQVYKSLPEPTLLAERTGFCAYQQATLLADNCAGKIEWQVPGSAGFSESSVNGRLQTAFFPGQRTTSTYTYAIRCNLNTCLSPEKTTVLTVYPAPKAPELSSNAVNNTIDRNGSISLSGSCATNETLIWDNLANSTITLASSATYYAYCKNTGSGCETQHKSAITITVLYLPPATPNPLTIASFNTRSISLQWGDNSDNEDGFWVYRSTSSSFADAIRIADLGRNTTTFTDERLSEGTIYYYRVVSHNRYDDRYSLLVSQSTAVTPATPSLTASSTYVERGSSVNISGSCAVGTLIWTSPSGFNGGTTTPIDKITYSAKCSSNGIDGLEASITVVVFDKPAVVVPTCTVRKPTLSLSTASGTASIQTGDKVNITASCAAGNLVWTSPANFAGGDSYPQVNTQYRARCVVSETCQSELVIQDIIVQGGTTTPPTNNPPTPPPTTCQVSKPTLSLSTANGTASIQAGEKVNITASCATGLPVWETPSGFAGGDSYPQADTQYRARCVVDQACQSELVIQDIIVQGSSTTSNNPAPTTTPPPVACAVSKPTLSLKTVGGTASIRKGEKVNITASCEAGSAVWETPSGFTGGDSSPEVDTKYKAYCMVSESCKSELVTQDIIVQGTTTIPNNQPPTTTSPPITCQVSKPTLSLSTANGTASIQAGEKVNITASCATGRAVWTSPDKFAGGDSYPQTSVQYKVYCMVSETCQSELVIQDIIVQGTTTPTPPPINNLPGNIDPPPCVVSPPVFSLNGSNASIKKGDKINITATCATGSAVWETPSGFTGGDSSPEVDTKYKAYCMVSESCKSESVIQDIIVTTLPPTQPNSEFILSVTQPICIVGLYSAAILHLTNIRNADRYSIWSGRSYQGSNDCDQAIPFDGDRIDIPYGYASPVSSHIQDYTVRIWKSGNCDQSSTKTVTVTSPNCQTCQGPPFLVGSFMPVTHTMYMYGYGCTTDLNWYKVAMPSKTRTLIYTGDSLELSNGHYEIECDNSCGTAKYPVTIGEQ